MTTTTTIPKTYELRPRDIVALIVTIAALAAALTIGVFAITDGSRSSLTTPSGEAAAAPSVVDSDYVAGVVALSPGELAAGFSRDPVAVARAQYVAGVVALSPGELAAGFSRDPVAVARAQYVAGVTALSPGELAAAYSRTPVTDSTE
jgi:hypothetical protein